MHTQIENRRILVVDDTPAIHDDFRRILTPAERGCGLEEMEAALFGDEMADPAVRFEVESAFQGEEGVAKVAEELRAGRPFATAFVDMRMPPGWDGVQTVERIWEIDPRVQVVICTAYSDYSWRELTRRLQSGDRLLILKKPFDSIEIYQLAKTLTAKWTLARQAELKLARLEEGVAARALELAAANETLQARTGELYVTKETLQACSHELTLANEAQRADLAGRRAAEEEARDARQRLSDIVEFLPDPTFVVDKERRVIAWNRAIEELTGVGKEQMLGRGDHAYAIPFYGIPRVLLIDMLDEERAVQESCYAGVDRRGHTLCAEVKLLLRGEERLLWSAAAPLFDFQGNRVGGIQTIREITALRRSEQERSKIEARLEHANLQQSLVMQLNHALRTPMTPLIALLPVVRERTQDEALKRMLEVCERSAEQILALTSRSTEQVRSESRDSSTELVPVLLSRVARERLQKNAGLFTELGVECNCSEIDSSLTVLGLPDQLALLLDNLLSNAARHARRNGKVCIWALSAAGMVTVAVQDDGAGIAPDECEEIFGHADPAAGGDTAGTELAMCKRIVLNHGGSIWAESPGIGEGTTISFTLKEARQEPLAA